MTATACATGECHRSFFLQEKLLAAAVTLLTTSTATLRVESTDFSELAGSRNIAHHRRSKSDNGTITMADDTKVVIRDGQWLGSGDLFADYGNEEVIVALDSQAVDHPLISAVPDNEHGQSVQSSREAMNRASAAASRAKARGNIDADGRILVAVQDLTADE